MKKSILILLLPLLAALSCTRDSGIMKTKIYIVAFALALPLCSCRQNDLNCPPLFWTNFVHSSFFIPEYDYYSDNCLLAVHDTSLEVKIFRDNYKYRRPEIAVNILSTDRKKVVFDYLALKHRDGDFDSVFCYDAALNLETYDSVTMFKHNACMVDISSITVRSSEAWDEAHPAGEPLDDIVIFDGTSVYPFIASGYSPDVPRDYAITKPLTSMEAEDYYMVLNWMNDWTFRLRFARRPTVRPFERRTLTVEITFDDGSVLTSSVEADFILRRQEGA